MEPIRLDKSEAASVNLATLQRLDDAVVDVVLTVSHVAVYSLDADAGRWQKRDVEGAMFLVERDTEPRYQVIILNRKNPVNFVVDVSPALEMQLKKPYILLRDSAHTPVHGIWFRDELEQAEAFNVLAALCRRVQTEPAPAAPARAPAPAPVEARRAAEQATYAAAAPAVIAPTVAALFAKASQTQAAAAPVPAAAPAPVAAVPAVAGAALTLPSSLGAVSIMLSKKQLQQMLLEMVQDDDFIGQLHSKYVQAIARQAANS